MFGTTTLLVAISSFTVIVILDLRICDFLYNSLFFLLSVICFYIQKRKQLRGAAKVLRSLVKGQLGSGSPITPVTDGFDSLWICIVLLYSEIYSCLRAGYCFGIYFYILAVCTILMTFV